MNIWKYVKGVLLIFGVPTIVYLFAKWDPFILRNEFGEPERLGVWFVAVPYWTALFFAHKYWSENKKLKQRSEEPVAFGIIGATAQFKQVEKLRAEQSAEREYRRPPKGWQSQKKDDKDIV